MIAKNEQLSTQLHDHLKVENSILLKPEYETSKHLVDTLQVEEKEILKIYSILKNWNVHYDYVYQQLTKSRVNLTKLYKVQGTSTDLKLWQELDQQISLERAHIDQILEEDNQWLKHSCIVRYEIH